MTENPDTRYSMRDDGSGENAPSKNLSWAIDRSIIDRQDQGALWRSVNRLSHGETVVRFDDGLYMVERGNKIMITDADADFPSLTEVYEIKSKDQRIINAIKGAFYYEAGNGGNSEMAYRAAGIAFGEKSISQHRNASYRANGRTEQRGEGSLRGADDSRDQERYDKGVKRYSLRDDAEAPEALDALDRALEADEALTAAETALEALSEAKTAFDAEQADRAAPKCADDPARRDPFSGSEKDVSSRGRLFCRNMEETRWTYGFFVL